MKPKSIFLLLTFIPVSLCQVETTTANLNGFLDVLFDIFQNSSLRTYVTTYPADVKLKLGGIAEIKQIVLSGLDTLQRYENTSLAFTGESLVVTIGVGLQHLKVSLIYAIFGVQGNIDVSANDVHVLIVVQIPAGNVGSIKIDKLDITNLGNLQIGNKDKGLINKILNSNLARNQIQHLIEDQGKTMIQNLLKNITLPWVKVNTVTTRQANDWMWMTS